MAAIDLSTHEHDASKRALYDARGIFCTFVCDRCEAQKRLAFRSEIFTNPNYPADEAIDDEDDPWFRREDDQP